MVTLTVEYNGTMIQVSDPHSRLGLFLASG